MRGRTANEHGVAKVLGTGARVPAYAQSLINVHRTTLRPGEQAQHLAILPPLNQIFLWQLVQFVSCCKRELGLSKTGHSQVASPTMSVRRRGEAKQTNGSANGTVKDASNAIVDPKTDHARWRLRNDDGRQTWHYLDSDEELKSWPMSAADKYYLGMDTVSGNYRYLQQP